MIQNFKYVTGKELKQSYFILFASHLLSIELQIRIKQERIVKNIKIIIQKFHSKSRCFSPFSC